MSQIYFPPFPKKIDRSVLYTQSSLFSSIEKNTDKAYIVEPLFTIPSLEQARRRVVADCLARAHNIPLISSISPAMMTYSGISPSMVWETRYRLSYEIEECLHRLGIRLSCHNILDPETIHTLGDVAQRLSDHHSVSCRDDVTFFNINRKTVVPDHRVLQEVRKGTRYHMRFFVEGKKHSIVASLDEPCFLFACVAILVNPLDKRYKKLIGKDVIVPLINKAIPLRAHESVSMEGHGTMVLIPAHRREDYHLALEMALPTDIYAIDQYGCFTVHAKDFAGKSMITFRENIVKFLDDISNIDQKEYTSIPYFVDSQTNDILLPILQKNIFLSLYADTLHTILMDESITMKACPDTVVDMLAGKDSRWCISGRDTLQSKVAYTIDSHNDLQTLSLSQTLPLLTCLVADAVMMGMCPALIHLDTLIEGLLVIYRDRPLFDYLLSYYETYHHDLYVRDKGDKFRQLFEGLMMDDEKLTKYSEDLLHHLETSDGIICTDQGYMVSLPSHNYSYDHEYIALLQIVATLSHLMPSRQLSYFFTMQESYRLRHNLFLLHHMSDRRKDIITPYATIDSLVNISISDDSIDDNYMQQCDIYGGDVVRLSLLLTSSLMDEETVHVYSLDMLHRFIHKRRNASRFITMTFRASDISFQKKSLMQTIATYADKMTEYDIRILTNTQRIINDVIYYRDRYAIATSVHLCIQSLWYDLAEMSLIILKHYSSVVTSPICSLAVFAGGVLMQAYAPHSAGSLLSCLGTDPKDSISLDEICALDYTKNYKCTLMMDVIRQRHILLSQSQGGFTSVNLLLQANKDFADYVARHEEFIMYCFPQASINYISESDTIDETIAQSRIMNVVVALQIQHKEPEPVVSLSVLTGQHAYKKQLIQTLRNTIMRLRQSRNGTNDQQIVTLESQIVDLQKEIEKLEYTIAKMKYYKS